MVSEHDLTCCLLEQEGFSAAEHSCYRILKVSRLHKSWKKIGAAAWMSGNAFLAVQLRLHGCFSLKKDINLVNLVNHSCIQKVVQTIKQQHFFFFFAFFPFTYSTDFFFSFFLDTKTYENRTPWVDSPFPGSHSSKSSSSLGHSADATKRSSAF